MFRYFSIFASAIKDEGLIIGIGRTSILKNNHWTLQQYW